MRPDLVCAVLAAALAVGPLDCPDGGEPPLREAAAGVTDADRALAAARRAVLHADHLALRRSRGEEVLLSREIAVIRRRAKVRVWQDGRRLFTAAERGRCYRRDTDVNPRVPEELREAAAPADVTGARMVDRGRTRVVLARELHSDFADTEFRIRIDASGRPLAMRERPARHGVLPPGPWIGTRYEFVGAAEVRRRAGGPPGPRCR